MTMLVHIRNTRPYCILYILHNTGKSNIKLRRDFEKKMVLNLFTEELFIHFLNLCYDIKHRTLSRCIFTTTTCSNEYEWINSVLHSNFNYHNIWRVHRNQQHLKVKKNITNKNRFNGFNIFCFFYSQPNSTDIFFVISDTYLRSLFSCPYFNIYNIFVFFLFVSFELIIINFTSLKIA